MYLGEPPPPFQIKTVYFSFKKFASQKQDKITGKNLAFGYIDFFLVKKNRLSFLLVISLVFER